MSFFWNIGQENVFYNILEQKTPFEPIKQHVEKFEKLRFFRRG